MCSCDTADGYCDVWERSLPVASREYRCCECSKTIRRGEQHEKVGALFEGSWSTYRTCGRCVALRFAHSQTERALHGERCAPLYEELFDTIRGCMHLEGRMYAIALQKAVRELKSEAA